MADRPFKVTSWGSVSRRSALGQDSQRWMEIERMKISIHWHFIYSLFPTTALSENSFVLLLLTVNC